MSESLAFWPWLVASYESAVAANEARGALQPNYPVWDFVLWGNIVYAVVTPLLYFGMSQRKEGFSLKPFMAVYNLICVALAGYVFVGIVRLKWEHPGT